MKNILITSDHHIKESELEECNLIHDELITIKEQYNIDTYINAGDSFDRINPSPKEVDCFSTFLTKLNIPSIIIAAKSHESISANESILNHFGILNKFIQILPEYKDENHLYIGHFILKESKLNYGATKSKKAFSKFRYVILGHQHSYELIKPNCCQLGSTRYINFDESNDKSKKILVITDYNEESEKCHFLDLKTPYPMASVVLDKSGAKTRDLKGKQGIFESISDLKTYLNTLNPKTKVRIVFKDYELWRAFLPIFKEYESKFILLKEQKEFMKQIINQVQNQKNIPILESLKNWMQKNKVEETIQNILLKEFV